MLRLENRPTDLTKIAKAVAVGVAVAVPLLGFVAPLLTQVNLTEFRVGQQVDHPVFGHGTIDAVNPMEKTVFVDFPRTHVVISMDKMRSLNQTRR